MRYYFVLFAIVLIDLCFILLGIDDISISYKEAVVLYQSNSFLHHLVSSSIYIFGENDYALRTPMILLHILSIALLYKISEQYMKEPRDRLYSVVIFILLPGVASSSLVVTSASLSIFFTLLFLYLFQNGFKKVYYPLLPLLLLVDNSFFILFLALFGYGIYKQDRDLYILNAILFVISLYLFGFTAGGRPRTYFLDTLAMYAIILSPMLFLYYFYTMYRILFKQKKTLLWFISFSALVISLLLSFRERISIVDFAPFIVISTPLVVANFLSSFRVRLPKHQLPYKVGLIVTTVFLTFNFLFTYFNKYLYLYDNEHKHFARKYHIAKELANKLHTLGINSINCESKEMALRLRFYNINSGNDYYLSEIKPQVFYKKVTISYKSKNLKSYYVTKLHTLDLK
jgi:hypothetical protein